MSEGLDEFKKALGGDVVIDKVTAPGGLGIGDVLATRAWFSQRLQRMRSTGGRPSDPKWTIRRQIPFSAETWERLKVVGEAIGAETERALAPGQVAALLVERGVEELAKNSTSERTASHGAQAEVSDVKLRERRLPDLFAGPQAA